MRAVAPVRRVAVLDVESVPDGDALSQGRRHAGGGHGRPALHRLVAAGVLACTETDRGFADLQLRVFAHPACSEVELIGCVDLMLPDPADERSMLVTWNGGHDLRLLRHRACSNWLFGLDALPAWCGAPAGRHRDLMKEVAFADPRGRWALADVCAGLGFAIRNGLSGQPVLTLHARGRHDAVAEHCMLDVVGTFMVYAYHRSFETGDDRFAATAWSLVAEALGAAGRVDPDVQSLADHHLASIARSRLTRASLPPPSAAGAPGR